jgi:FG-GAP repeat
MSSPTAMAAQSVRGGKAATQDSQPAELQANLGDELGTSVALAGNVALAGSPYGRLGLGATEVYVRPVNKRDKNEPITFGQRAELTASDGLVGDEFGQSVALEDTPTSAVAVIGAPGRSDSAGVVYVFTEDNSDWTQTADLTPPGGTISNEQFGEAVALDASGDTVAIGAPGADGASGVVYVFTDTGGAWTEAAELTAPDSAANAAFGASVSIAPYENGLSVLVGAPGALSSAGRAYVFTGAGATWSPPAELVASDAATGDEFGSSVSTSGVTAVVGAPGRRSSTGAVYVFDRGKASWHQTTELTAPDGDAGARLGASVSTSSKKAVLVGAPGNSSITGHMYEFTEQKAKNWIVYVETSDQIVGDGYGSSIASSQTIALVGAPLGSSDSGGVYTLLHWKGLQELTPSALFGESVAISGSTAVVGVGGTYGGVGDGIGAAFVFLDIAGTWAPAAELVGSDETPGDDFGASVAISGDTIVVAAPEGDGNAGAVYIFTGSGSTWTQSAELTASDGYATEAFGSSIAISGTTVVAGAPGHLGSSGAAYVFTLSGSTWTQMAELLPSDAATYGLFGVAVAVSGTTIAVAGSSARRDTYVFDETGSTWSQVAELSSSASLAISGTTLVVGGTVFTQSGSGWSETAVLTGSDEMPSDEFGASVAIDGSTVVVGAPEHDGGLGSAYVFTGSGPTWSQTAELTPSDVSTNGEFGSSVAVSGTNVAVGAPATSSATGVAYVFEQ